MTKVISIGTDRNIFKENSAVRTRQTEYGTLFEELHLVIFTKRASSLPAKVQISPNVWAYSTNSFFKFSYVNKAVKLAGQIIKERSLSPSDSIVTVQDPFETGIAGVRVKKMFGLPLHVQIHTDLMSPHFKNESVLNRFRVKIAGRILAQADAVRTVSKKIADGLSAINLKPGLIPTVLPIFANVERFENAPIIADLKVKYPQFNFIILMASRLTREKNIAFALSVFRKILKVYEKTGLVIVGDGPEKGRLKRLAKKLGLEKNIAFENWQDDLASYYKTAGMFLLTSNYEGYGLTVVEAIASHCPAVSTDVGIAPEVLKNGDISFVCPVGCESCFIGAISKLIESPGLREKCVHEARTRLDKVTISDKKEYLERYRQSIESALSG